MGVTSMLKNKKLIEKSASRNGANHVYKIMFIFCRYITGSMTVYLYGANRVVAFFVWKYGFILQIKNDTL
jgi:hypothetical protein